MPRSKNEIGIWLSLGGYSAWVVGDTFIKMAGDTLTLAQIMTVVLTTLMVCVIGLACVHGGIKGLGSRRPFLQLLSAILNASAGLGAVIGITHLTLADFYTMAFTAPLIVTMLAWFFLKEKATWKTWAAIASGFVGVMIAVHLSNTQGHTLSAYGIGGAMACAIFYSFSQIIVRAYPGETNYSLSFWPRVVGLAVCGAYFLFHHDANPWSAIGIFYSTLGGVGSTIGVIFTNLSLKYAPVSVVSPYHYSQIIGAALIGYLVWHTPPSAGVIIGSAIIVASGLFILRQQQIAAKAFATDPT